MSKTSDMSSPIELLCQIGPVMELPMLAFHQASAVLTGDSLYTRFEVARSESYSGQDVESELARLGVAITGRGFAPGTRERPFGSLTFHVKASQRRWAEYVLRCAKFDVVTVVDAGNAGWAAQHDGPVPAWSGRSSKMGTVAKRAGSTPTLAVLFEEKSAKSEKRKGGFQRLIDWLME